MVFQTRSGFSLPSSDEHPTCSTTSTAWDPCFTGASQLLLTPGAFRLRAPPSVRTAPFASISSGALQVGLPGSTPLLRRDAATGLEFPSEFCYLTSANCPSLTGLGVRAKRILGLKNINVYALGIYVDVPAASKALGTKYKGVPPAALAVNQQLYDDVVASEGYEKTLRLVISFGSLQRRQFVDALQERINPLLIKAGDPSAMQSFSALFDGVEFKRGLEITFVDGGQGRLVTHIAGKQRGVIQSPALVRSLFQVYLGPDPASAEAKVSFGLNLASALHGGVSAV